MYAAAPTDTEKSCESLGISGSATRRLLPEANAAIASNAVARDTRAEAALTLSCIAGLNGNSDSPRRMIRPRFAPTSRVCRAPAPGPKHRRSAPAAKSIARQDGRHARAVEHMAWNKT